MAFTALQKVTGELPIPEGSANSQLETTAARFHLPRWVWLATAALMAWGSFSANPYLTPFAILLLPFFAVLLWRPHEPPVLVFACAMQWLQAAGVIFYANSYDLPLIDLYGGPQLEWATWLSLGAVAANALGMRAALLHLPPIPFDRLSSVASRTIIPNAFIAYLAGLVISTIARAFAFAVPAFAQAIVALGTVKWVMIFLLFYSVIQRRTGYGFLWAAFFIEISIGIGGYFSDFKSVFFVLLMAALTTGALRRKQLFAVGTIATVLFVMGVVWSAIKEDYRAFLNQGTGEQVVSVTFEERSMKLSELLDNFSWASFTNGVEALTLRVSQVDLFARTLVNVPNAVAHTRGALWQDAVKRIMTPRFLFPEKTAVDDSERAKLYTGTEISGVDQGTSMGIGYVAESYVDFGRYFMFVPIFLLGSFYGFIYRFFALRSRFALIGTSIAVAILVFGAYTLETSNIKLLGLNMAAVLVLGGLYLFLARILDSWVRF